ncbi:hypothetical protein [Hymenobacter sp. BT559]|uniref:hypothetical protein n=1 Tax=Hymenobacter sp. BT559 TaxID=2795729 RepID=UPI0018EDD23D|nr:hypothetical protein [Hymenobacter sp. BT559]MBJ6146375.1 hypothetical protein [Hymenobacter sp. BT559]
MSTLSSTDKDHLSSISQTMNWAMIARVMQALGWRWYHIHGRSPNPGEIRDEAMNHLTQCIHEARESDCLTATMHTGGLEYTADVCPISGNVEHLYCAFILESQASTDPDTYGHRQHCA